MDDVFSHIMYPEVFAGYAKIHARVSAIFPRCRRRRFFTA